MSSKIKLDNDYFIQIAKTGEMFLRKDNHTTTIGKDGKERESIVTICYPSTVLNGIKHYITLKIAESGFDGNLNEYINRYEELMTKLAEKIKF